MVSILCITYNHEHYISDAIESFLMQKTNFKYEILIGEDCSIDNTREIVKEYIKKYPSKIKLITSEKNVGAKMNFQRIHNLASGKYIALCEGDDYWTNPLKLQKQVDYMEQHLECNMCFHAAERVTINKKPIGNFLGPFGNGNSVYTLGDIGGNFLPTASKMYKKTMLDNLPKWYFEGEAGDYSSTLIILNKGYAYYIDEVMAAYRVGVPGSSNDRLNKSSKDDLANWYKLRINTLNSFNEYSNFIHNDDLKRFNLPYEIKLILLEDSLIRRIMAIKNLKNKGYFLDFHMKIKLFSRCFFPFLYEQLHIVKVRIKKWSKKV